ncbi:MAG: response regulator [Nitrospirota bacterium]
MKKKDKTILFVDDDMDFLNYVAESFRKDGYHVIAKTDGRAALSVFNETRIDLVITDLKMPYMDGMEFISALRSKTPLIPVILLSGHGNVELYFKALSYGVYEVINKPISMRELKVVAKSALSGSSIGLAEHFPLR